MKWLFSKPTKIAPLVRLSFDGVVYSARTNDVDDRQLDHPPVPGAIPFILKLLTNRYRVAIHCHRSYSLKKRKAMKNWLICAAGQQFFYSVPHQYKIPDSVDVASVTGALQLWIDAGFPHKKILDVDKNKPITGSGALKAGVWLVDQIEWPIIKPYSKVSLDPESIRFNGTFPDIEQINNFKSWYKS